MIVTRFFVLGGHVVSPSSEHSAAVGMLKLKVQPSNLPIVAPEKNRSVLEVDASCLWTDTSDILAAWIPELSAELLAVERLRTIDIRRWWSWDADLYASKRLRFL